VRFLKVQRSKKTLSFVSTCIPVVFGTLAGLSLIDPYFFGALFGLHTNKIEGAFRSIFVEVKFYVIFGQLYFLVRCRALSIFIGLFLASFVYSCFDVKNSSEVRSLASLIFSKWMFLEHFGWFCIGALV
jgi:hypothetical protein